MGTTSYRSQAAIRQVQKAVEWAGRTLELTDVELGGALGASARSVARWRGALHRPENQHVQAAESLLELAYALEIVFGNDLHRLQEWLHEPIAAFRGRTPLRMIADGKTTEVLTVLANIESGMFA